jgi:hypothetical protein
MKLTDFIPSKETMEGFRGVEQQLESRRYTGRWSLVVAIASGILQIALLLGIPALKTLAPNLRIPWFLPSSIVFVAAIVWVLLSYTGFLFKQSKEPFRYTFSINKFSVASTPGDRFKVDQIDQLELLRYDLTERLNRRVRRFSLYETPNKGGAAQSTGGIRATSHFHIDGDYAIREDETDGWILHVWPRVRIGPEGNPFTLAYPVRLPIEDGEHSAENKKGATLDLDEYERLVERVYSSVATEIYKQIEIDLRDKMTLFPTNSLRALARYIEAEDFETSNTIDAYDRALEMYQSSIDELEASRWHGWMKWWGRKRNRLVSWEFTGIRARMEAEAKTKLGYSRCLIYRRLVSEMAGRERNPIFDTRLKLKEARKLLQRCYSSFIPNPELRLPPPHETNDDSLEDTHDWCVKIALARDAVLRPLQRKQLYHQVRDELCEAFAVAGLAHSLLADSTNARRFLDLADALAVNTTSERVAPMLLLAKAELEPRLLQKVSYLNQASELNPASEIVLYRLAQYSDLLARDNDEITRERVNYLNGNYEAVLKVNPANIASLIGQGYLFWLVDDLEQARNKLRAGIELQKIVTQTFVGDLKYCLARVEVERVARRLAKSSQPDKAFPKALTSLNQAVFDYEEATIADPSVAAGYVDAQGKSRNAYYERVNHQILERYRLFACRTRRIWTVARKWNTKLQDDQIKNTLLSYALNDYGNACLNYYSRFEVSTGKDALLRKARWLLEKSRKLDTGNLMAEYNSFLVITQANDPESSALALTRSDSLLAESKSARLPPAALVEVVAQVVRAKSREYADLQYDETDLATLDKDIKELEQTIEDLGQKIKEAIDKDKQTIEHNQAVSSDQEQRARSIADRGLPGQEPNDFQKPTPPVSMEKRDRSPGGVLSQMESGGARASTAGALPDEPGAFSSEAQPVTNKPGQMEKAGQPRPASRSDEPNLRSLNNQSKPRTPEEIELAKDQQVLQEKKQRRNKITTLSKMLDKLEEPVRTFAGEKTSLAPFRGQLVSSRISELLGNEDIKWSDFGDREVFALVALATIWALRPDPDARRGSRQLCKHLLREYSPDDFTLTWTLFGVAEADEKGNCISVMNKNIEWSLQYDPKSRFYMRWKLAHREASVKLHYTGWPDQFSAGARYQRAIKLYRGAREQCGAFPEFHNSLAYAYECRARQLAREAENIQGSLENNKRVAVISQGVREMSKCRLQERREACRLDPNNQEYRDSFLAPLGRQLIAGNVFTDPLVEREVPKRIEIEVSKESVRSLGFTDKGLSTELQQKINDVRLWLRTGAGFVLPFINFRDNAAFEQKQFRFLIRGAPLPLENLGQPEAPPAEQWDTLARRIKEVALSNASRFYTSQDCYIKLSQIAKECKTDYTEIQNDPDSLFALTWVLQMLLREQVPIADFAVIVSEFQRCRNCKLDLGSTVEEIRSLPQIRMRLPGNSLDLAAGISLNPEVENRIDRAIDRKCSEPTFHESQGLRREIRSLAKSARGQAGRDCAVVLTSPAVRPFVFRMIEDMDVNVLSHREIFPTLLSRIKDADAAGPKPLRAQAGS